MTPTPTLRVRTRLALLLAFAAIAAMVVFVHLFNTYSSRAVEIDVTLIAEDSLVSIRLVERMEMDLERQRILVDQHILEPDAEVMEVLEAEIAATRADYAAAARQYEPLANYIGEATAWHQLKSDVASADGSIAAVLALSRTNMATEARDAMVDLEPRFVAIDRAVDLLVGLNQTEAEQALERVRDVQRDVLSLRRGMALFLVCVTICVGLWVTRLVSRKEEQINRYAAALEEQNRDLDAKVSAATAARVATLEQLRHADRLATVGRLASGLAHELGTPLNVAGGRAKMIQSGEVTGAEVQENARIIVERCEKMAKIIRHLLDFARPRPLAKKTEDLRQIARQTIALLEPMAARRKVSLVLEEGGPAAAQVDAGQLQQVLTNLIVNGIDSMPRGGRLTLGFRRASARPPADHGGPEAEYARIDVRDEGEGISPEHLGHIFEPFFTTKDVGAGTGLGLSVSHGIVREHGGWISVESKPGAGSAFSIYLP